MVGAASAGGVGGGLGTAIGAGAITLIDCPQAPQNLASAGSGAPQKTHLEGEAGVVMIQF